MIAIDKQSKAAQAYQQYGVSRGRQYSSKSSGGFSDIFDQLSISARGAASDNRDLTNAEIKNLKDKYLNKFNSLSGEDAGFERGMQTEALLSDLNKMGLLSDSELSALKYGSLPVIEGVSHKDSLPPEARWDYYDHSNPTSYYKYVLYMSRNKMEGFDTSEWQEKIPAYEKAISLLNKVFQ